MTGYDEGPYEIRSRAAGSLGAFTAVMVALPFLIAAASVYAQLQSGFPLWALVLTVTALLAPAVIVMLRSVVRVSVGDGFLTRRFRSGRSTSVPVTEVGEVLVVQTYLLPRAQMTPLVFVLGTDGSVLQRMSGQFFDRPELADFAQRLSGGRATTIVEPVTARQLNRLRPGLVPWPVRYPTLAGVALGVALIVVLLIGVGIFDR